jgi:hypothetical protein
VIRDHVLLPIAGSVFAADERLAPRLHAEVIQEIVATIPDELLEGVPPFATPQGHREAYVTHLTHRLGTPRRWVAEAEEARLAES